jgi:pyruvate/2-oxoglutarate dehydrogenase complex dihydrolipoamide dehydrogenase (E3) component
VSEAIAEILREDDIEVLLDAVATQVEQTAPGGKDLTLVVKTPEGERTLQGSHLLVAAGRKPNTEDLNLPAAGVQTDEHGYVRVNERLETNVPGIFALGDVKGGPAFTHISYDDYRILKANLLDGKAATTTGRMVPYVVFMDPELGRVGLTEQEARALGRPIRVAKMPMSHVARALELDESRGFMKVVIDVGSEQILGCAILGIEGGEIMSALEIAMMGRVPYTALRDATFAHPTFAEALNNLFMTSNE